MYPCLFSCIKKLHNVHIKGVVSEIKKLGYEISQGFNAYIVGNLPNGASLSSSASLELLFGEIIRDLNDLPLTDLDLVKIGQNAENKFVGLHCGIMDQFAIGMSKKDHAILLDCATLKYDYAPLKLKDNVILILNTNKRRDLVTSKYNERRAECDEALAIIQKEYKNVKVIILGPSPASMAKVNNRYRYRMIIKCRNNAEFREMLRKAIDIKLVKDTCVWVDINPETIV